MSQIKVGLPQEMQILLKKFFLTILKDEIKIESQRQLLASMEGFEPYPAFLSI